MLTLLAHQHRKRELRRNVTVPFKIPHETSPRWGRHYSKRIFKSQTRTIHRIVPETWSGVSSSCGPFSSSPKTRASGSAADAALPRLGPFYDAGIMAIIELYQPKSNRYLLLEEHHISAAFSSIIIRCYTNIEAFYLSHRLSKLNSETL